MNRDLALSRQQEKRFAKAIGGQVNKGSGSGWVHKNDARSERFLVENKRTSNKQITIKAQTLEELRKQAILDGRAPVLHVEIGTRRCVILLEDDYLELIGEQ